MNERTVLIVDDDADIREIVQFASKCSRDGSCSARRTGKTPWPGPPNRGRTSSSSTVNLAGMDGPATLAALRADPRTAAIPVLFLTANTRSADVERLRGLGADGVLAKPFDPLSLGSQVAREMRWTERRIRRRRCASSST